MSNPLAWKIGILGSHGTGKTTAALAKASELKTERPSRRVVMISEIARKCPFAVNRQTTPVAQLWIFHAQCLAEIEATKEADYIVCDRTVLDNLAYAQAAGFSLQIEYYLPLAIEWMKTYRELYFLRPGPEGPADDGFRDRDWGFQFQIDQILAQWIRNFSLSVIPAKAGIQSSR